MLKRLRVKLVCINMALLMTMLCVILGLVVRFTRAGLEAESLRMMQAAARPAPPGHHNRLPEDFRLPCLVLRLSRDGQAFTGDGAPYGRAIGSAVDIGERAGEDTGPYGWEKGPGRMTGALCCVVNKCLCFTFRPEAGQTWPLPHLFVP